MTETTTKATHPFSTYCADNNMSNAELGRRLGIDPAGVSRIIRGSQMPTLAIAFEAERLLSIPMRSIAEFHLGDGAAKK